MEDQNWDRKLANVRFENMPQFKYLGDDSNKLNLIQEEIKRRFNSGNACYHSVQSLLSSRLLFKNFKIRFKFCPWFCMYVQFGL
jgi:hypothetical protein